MARKLDKESETRRRFSKGPSSTNDMIGPAYAKPDTGSLLRHVWLIASAVMLLAMLAGVGQIQLRKRSWTRGMMCGVYVYISEDEGLTIICLFPPYIVVPRWLTTCRREDQEAVILHETSHREARNAQLLVQRER